MGVKQEITETIWDLFLLEGNSALFKTTLALFELPEENVDSVKLI